MFRALLNTFSQPSTYAGLAGIAGAAGVSAPEFQAVSGLIATLCGAAAVFLNERGTPSAS